MSAWRAWLVAAAFVLAAAGSAHAGEAAAGTRLSACDIRTLAGSRIEFPAAPGLATVIVLWSPASLAARKSISELDRFHAEHGDRVRIVAATPADDEALLHTFLRENRLRVPVGLAHGPALRPPADAQLPMLYFFDAHGELRITRSGLFRYKTLERGVEALGTAGEG